MSECHCGNNIEHWKAFSGQALKECGAKNCDNQDLFGVLVQKEVPFDSSWYIVPLCFEHYDSLMPIEIADDTILVVANKLLTCEKRPLCGYKTLKSGETE